MSKKSKSKRIVHWLDDYDGSPVLIYMTPEQMDYAKVLFLGGERLEDMSVLEAYLGTMPTVKNGWICTDMFDGAHLFNPTDEQF